MLAVSVPFFCSVNFTIAFGLPVASSMVFHTVPLSGSAALAKVAVDYIKAPQFIRLTQEQMDLTEDTSQIMEFPDYVCQEIINELVHLVMEHDGDPRLQSNIPMSQSIAQPAQQQEQPQQARRQ